MKVWLSLVPWLLAVVIATHASVIPRNERVTAELDVTVGTMEDGMGRENDRGPTQHHHHHRQHHEHLQRSHSTSCPGCRQWQGLVRSSEEELLQLRIEKIKQDLLSRLGLSSPPNVTVNHIQENIPAPLQHKEDATEHHGAEGGRVASLNEEEDSDELVEGHTKQIIVFAEEAGIPHRHHRRHNLHFTLLSEVPADTVLSVELWLYKNTDSDRPNCTNSTQTVSVHSLAGDDTPPHLSNETSPHSLASQEVPPHEGWFRMDFLDAVQSWMADPSSNRGLGVEHSDCVTLSTRGLSHRPFLTLGTRRAGTRRRKRSAQQCPSGAQNCCRKHTLYIDFQELGWNFIYSPPGFHANYCHGPCSVPAFENLMNTRLGHASLLQKLSRLRNNPDLLPCCSPTSLSSLSLLYINDVGETIQQNVENIRVDSCGCS